MIQTAKQQLKNNVNVQKPKKPRKPRQKKKTKKELEQERKKQEELFKRQQQTLLEQRKQQKLLMEQQIQKQKELVKQKYLEELAKLPKVYKRTFARNYKPLKRSIQLVNGYDINYISQIGEKIDANKPIFLFPPELGSINLHALNMSLQSKMLGEINTALNTLLVTSADSMLKINLDKYPDLLDSICVLALDLLSTLCEKEEADDSEKKKFYDFRKCKDANYCEEYDVESYLSCSDALCSRSDGLIDQVFEAYVNNGSEYKEHNDTVSVPVDSLTGADLQQVPISLITPAATPVSTNFGVDLLQGKSEEEKVVRSGCKPKEWNFMPNPVRLLPGQSLSKLYIPSYLESLRNVTEEINTPFTKVNTRGAEDKNILLTDQLSTVSMILRNISFSEKNSKMMAKNSFLRRYISDLIWALFLNHEKFVLNRKAFNLKKDLLIILTNISHAYEVADRVDCFLLLLLMLSFGEPKRSKELESVELTYPEFLLSLGSYHGFCVDVLAKLMSLNYPNRQFFIDVFMFSLVGEEKSTSIGSECSTNDMNDDSGVILKLLHIFNKGDKFKFLNDVFSFLVSVIPFMQINAAPNLIEEVAPVVSQSLTCILAILHFFDLKESLRSNNDIKNLPLIWLTSSENLGYNLRRLSDVLGNLTIQADKNSLHMKKMLISISCKCIEVTRLLVQKSLEISSHLGQEKRKICERLASIHGLLPSESWCVALLSNPVIDPSYSKQIESLYTMRNEILSYLRECSTGEGEIS